MSEPWIRRITILVSSVSFGLWLANGWAGLFMFAVAHYVNAALIETSHAFQLRAHEIRYALVSIREQIEARK
jgi:hypothetical protein